MLIVELNQTNLQDISKLDGEFLIDSRLVLTVENDQIYYSFISIPIRTKRYKTEEMDYQDYLNDPERTIFLAYIDNQFSGQIILSKNWNGFAYIDDIAVDVKFRRQGVGTALIEKAKQWARGIGFPGIMLETQDVNVGACKLYENCGFKLKGFDSYLYKAIEGVQDEVALYWYYFFDDD